MNVNQLIYRNLKNNLRNYYLYVFALIFSVSIYFAFVTLQYDASMDPATGTIKGQAAVRAGTIVLILIVGVFLVYANNLFIKRRLTLPHPNKFKQCNFIAALLNN